MRRGRSSAVVLLAVAGFGAPAAAHADQAPGQSKTAYLQSGDYARDVVAAAAPASAWIEQRADQLDALTGACRAYGLPVGAAGKPTAPTIAEPTAAQVARARSTARASTRAARRSRTATARSRRLARKAGTSATVRRKARARARVLARRARVAARAARVAQATITPAVARPAASDCRGAIRPAVVFDIDETLLSNYIGVPGSDPETGSAGQFPGALSGTGTRMPGVSDAYELAKRRGFSIFLITARPAPLPGLRETTVRNLAAAGYTGYAGLSLKANPAGSSATYKAGERAAIEARGFTVVANVGDQESDLAGGHAERAFKLPNPFYTG
ncbi:HAD family acid phosphatase [Patulibacter sp.]|uniref:HAD family acid phosphatase n=1 Tax=Patulibacter sp. TaxID=1912859 RepID=UPI002723F1D4|nr:HAD family acid phosphatase [Patulibacter sp.]MDO9406864.1 HAD family acid phosphatase [Patulibacter sp.]